MAEVTYGTSRVAIMLVGLGRVSRLTWAGLMDSMPTVREAHLT